jgi:transcriptional regulator with XRE-family HTH domain
MMEKDNILIELGARIKELRASKNLTQETVADKCDWDFTTVSRIENGKTNITMESIIKLCNAMDVTLEELFKGVGK